MEQILQFILFNKYILIVSLIAFIIQFEGLAYLMSHKQSDFSYSGHSCEWYDGDTKKTILVWSLYFTHIYSNSAIERI